MICIGYEEEEKRKQIAAYVAAHAIRHVVVIAPAQFPLLIPDADQVDYTDVIMYTTFYRLLREIDGQTLIVCNECLRTQNRNDLAYNCIRHYLNRTSHQVIFQYLPQIDTREDFMTLFDFDTQSRWKRRSFDAALIAANAQVCVQAHPPVLQRIDVPASDATRRCYAERRERLFAELGARDPHTLPRTLALIGGKDKARYIGAQSGTAARYVARNQRLGLANITTYEHVQRGGGPYAVVEFPHRYLDWCDFVSITGQYASDVLVTDLKVDDWYFRRFSEWGERICETCTDLQRADRA